MSDSEKKSKHVHSSNIGPEYQADIEDFNNSVSVLEIPDKDILIWKPIKGTDYEKFLNFVKFAHFKHGFTYDQSLAFITKFGLNEAVKELNNWDTINIMWTLVEKSLFEQAFKICSKNFAMIQEILPYKTLGQIINYYYYRKRYKYRKRLMDEKVKIYPELYQCNSPHSKQTFSFLKPSLWKKEKMFPSQASCPLYLSDFKILLENIPKKSITCYPSKSTFIQAAPTFCDKLFHNYDKKIYELNCQVRQNYQIIAKKLHANNISAIN